MLTLVSQASPAMPLQSAVPMLHTIVDWQTPVTQPEPVPQTFPHAPQLVRSLGRCTQRPLHQV